MLFMKPQSTYVFILLRINFSLTKKVFFLLSITYTKLVFKIVSNYEKLCEKEMRMSKIPTILLMFFLRYINHKRTCLLLKKKEK